MQPFLYDFGRMRYIPPPQPLREGLSIRGLRPRTPDVTKGCIIMMQPSVFPLYETRIGVIFV